MMLHLGRGFIACFIALLLFGLIAAAQYLLGDTGGLLALIAVVIGVIVAFASWLRND